MHSDVLVPSCGHCVHLFQSKSCQLDLRSPQFDHEFHQGAADTRVQAVKAMSAGTLEGVSRVLSELMVILGREVGAQVGPSSKPAYTSQL